MMNWLEQYLKNYRGESDEAKECEKFLKQNYKGDSYLPWAFMVRCLYTQDPKASYNVIYTEDNNMIHLNSYNIETKNKNNDVDISTVAQVLCPQIKMRVTFLDHTFEDTYPIQDKSYGAPKAVDQNMLNKAKQRCLARLISMATGIGWKLYEGSDLQFEDDGEKSKKEDTKEIKEIKLEKNEPKQELSIYDKSDFEKEEPAEKHILKSVPLLTEDVELTLTPEIRELVDFIWHYEDKEKLNRALAGLNNSCIRRYNFAFSASDSLADLISKANKLDKPSKFLASIKNKLS